MFALRLSSNALVNSASVAHGPQDAGTPAPALWSSGPEVSPGSSHPFLFTWGRFSGAAGECMICFRTSPDRVDSESAMCSETSATDQQPGAGLKVHCFCERPAIELRKLSCVFWNCCNADSRSSGLSGTGAV